jgi:hypothetical protein
MVVISACVCNKAGKIIVARQFVPVTRIKLEEYIANFPKLIEAGKVCMTYIGRKAMHPYRDRQHQVRLPPDREALSGVGDL